MKQRNLERRWEICQEAVGRRHMDNTSRERINKTDKITDRHMKRPVECKECERGRRSVDEKKEQGFQVNGGLVPG